MRTLLKLSPRQYDAIISEPSNPWRVGVGSVFSREFYELAAGRLKEGGIMCQWFHVYEMNDGIVSLVLRTFNAVFPHVELWDPGSGDIILLGGKRRWKSSPEIYRRLFEREPARADFEAIGLKTPEALWARQLASQSTAFAIAGDGPLQSDAFPILEYEAPRAFFVGASAVLFGLFDERTWQSEVASPEKRAALSALDFQSLVAVFSRYNSVNTQLNQFLTTLFQSPDDPHRAPLVVDHRIMPCAFLPERAVSAALNLPLNGSPELKQLMEADGALKSNPGSWEGPVRTIERTLRNYKPRRFPGSAEWSPSSFAALGARACFSHGDLTRAKELVALGLQVEPSAELYYLSRIFERQPASGETGVQAGAGLPGKGRR